MRLSQNQEDLLFLLAKRNGFPNARFAGQNPSTCKVWHNTDPGGEVEICLVCGKEVKNCFAHENDIYEHGLAHIKQSNLISFI